MLAAAVLVLFTWDVVPQADRYQLGCGLRPGRYTKRYSSADTDLTLEIRDNAPVYCAVRSYSNAARLYSDYSNEVVIEPVQPRDPDMNEEVAL